MGGTTSSNLKVVVQFGIKDNGEIVGLKIVQPSGDPSYDESVLRAVKKSSPLPAPPESYRKDFADVELTFRPQRSRSINYAVKIVLAYIAACCSRSMDRAAGAVKGEDRRPRRTRVFPSRCRR